MKKIVLIGELGEIVRSLNECLARRRFRAANKTNGGIA